MSQSKRFIVKAPGTCHPWPSKGWPKLPFDHPLFTKLKEGCDLYVSLPDGCGHLCLLDCFAMTLLNVRHKNGIQLVVAYNGSAGQPISTRSSCKDLRAAYLYATTPHMFTGDTETAFNRVRDQANSFSWGPRTATTLCTSRCQRFREICLSAQQASGESLGLQRFCVL
jgi:hypothetical protein